jgi:hypothetical protein
MAAAMPLEHIIKADCLPLKDCMLTVIDAEGEAAFLYFKEGELVEANYATLWGRDALTEILSWEIRDRTVAPLPLGIKRSLWDPLEYLLNPTTIPSTSGRLPLPRGMEAKIKAKMTAGSSVLDRYKEIPHLLKMVQLDAEETVLYEGPPETGESEETGWLVEFAGRAKSVGETLGFGACEKWTIETEKHQIVGFPHEERSVALMRGKDAMQEDLETAVAAIKEA